MGVIRGVLIKTLLLQVLQLLCCNAQCYNTSHMVVERLGLSDKQFWKAKSRDIEQCAKLCVRRKPCLSINYDSQSQMCELNAGTRNDTPTRSGRYLMYSEFQSWPASVDVNCYSRPCEDSEVCIPGSLADGSSECSHFCMKTTREVCPMPEFGVSAGRTVGSVNVYTCSKGFTGGGSATCLPSKKWDNELDTCTPIFEHQCSDNTLCSQIKASCSTNGKCECVGQYFTWDDTLKECVLDCQKPKNVSNAKVSGDKNTQTYECEADYYPTAGSVATVSCTVNGWVPENKFACYTCSGDPPAVTGATLSGSGKVRQYTCNSSNDLYPAPGSGDGNISCTETGSDWEPTGFKCEGLRLKEGTSANIVTWQGLHSGYLEMFVNDQWSAVTKHSWSWQATKVACKKIFGFSYGGSYHTKWFNTNNQSPLPKAIKLDKLSCTGDEDTLESCTYEVKDANIGDEIALTCFSYDFTSGLRRGSNFKKSRPYSCATVPSPSCPYESACNTEGWPYFKGEAPAFNHVVLNQVSGSPQGTLFVKIGGVYGAVCGSGWNTKRTEVACRSLQADWTRSNECKNSCKGPWPGSIYTNHVECDDDAPHLFYCSNRGWGFHNDCDSSKLVGIECDTGGGGGAGGGDDDDDDDDD